MNTRKSGAEFRDPPFDQGEIVDEQGRVARLGDELVGTAAADEQHGIGVGRKAGRYRAHRLAHAVSSFFSSTRSSLPFGLRGSSSRQMMAAGCMKLGRLVLRKARNLSSWSWRAGRTISAIASPSRGSGKPRATASWIRPEAIAASSISVGLIRFPALLIMPSSRPTK